MRRGKASITGSVTGVVAVRTTGNGSVFSRLYGYITPRAPLPAPFCSPSVENLPWKKQKKKNEEDAKERIRQGREEKTVDSKKLFENEIRGVTFMKLVNRQQVRRCDLRVVKLPTKPLSIPRVIHNWTEKIVTRPFLKSDGNVPKLQCNVKEMTKSLLK